MEVQLFYSGSTHLADTEHLLVNVRFI